MSGYCKDCGNQHCVCDGICGVSQGYDKYIKYNVLSDDEAEERQSVEQLSTAEMNMCIDFLNRMIYREMSSGGMKDSLNLRKLLQHMIYLYENYEHWAVISGYFNLQKVKEEYPIIRGSVVNPFNEKCFLKYIKGGQTECCFYDQPCKDHITDKIVEEQKKILNEVLEFNDHWGTGNYHRLPMDLEDKIKDLT